jgi:hypothetical protein
MESENQEYDMIEIITADINKLEDKSCSRLVNIV